MTTERRIRYAVVGAGNIAQTAVLPAFAHAEENSELVALVSGDAEKRRALCERYELNVEGDYEHFESVLEQGEIDAVYIATPNSHHKEFTLRAAARGVHVLCEKPLAPSSQDCREMIDACEAGEVKLMVAYRLHFEEATLAALDVVRSGRLGQPKLFSSTFAHEVRADDIRREPDLAGGAAFDLGVYCINAARNLFDAEPLAVLASKIERDGVDDTTFVILRFPKEQLAQFCVSNSAARVSSYRLVGTEGDLVVEPAYDYSGELVHHLTLGEDTKKRAFRKGDQFAPELRYFSQCILGNEQPEPSGEEGWCDVRVVEAVLASAASGQAVELEPYQRKRRPGLAQGDHAPPVKKPEPIRAPSPSIK